MPKQYQDLYSDMKSQTGGKWKDLYALSANGKDIKNMKSADFQQAYEELLLKNNEKMTRAFDEQTARLTSLSGLAEKISGTKDPKEIADLQARISAEQGAITLDATRFQMMKEAKAMELENLKANAHNQFVASLKKPFKMPDIHIELNKTISN
jgi:type IV secretion system protein VirB5